MRSETGIFLAVAAVAAVFVLPQLPALVLLSGNHLWPYPGQDLLTDYALGWAWALFLFIPIFFMPVSRKDRKALIAVWGAKIVMTLLLGLAYEYKYGLDTDGYFHAVDGWTGLVLNQGTMNVRQLAWLHALIIPDSYHATKVGFAAVGLVACYLFYRAAVLFLRREDLRIFYGLCLFPSILLWSSFLGKEPIMFLGMGLYAYGVMSWLRLKRWRGAVAVAAGCVVAAYVRMWYLPLMLGSFGALVSRVERNPTWRLAWAAIVLVSLVASVKTLGNYWQIESAADAFEFRTTISDVAFSGGGSSFEPANFNDPAGFLRVAPIAVFRALFRPLPLEVPSIPGTLEGLESVLYLYLLWLSIRRTRMRELFEPTVLWLTIIVVMWGVFYGSVVSNFGSLARYKLQIEPFELGLLLYLSRRRGTASSSISIEPALGLLAPKQEPSSA